MLYVGIAPPPSCIFRNQLIKIFIGYSFVGMPFFCSLTTYRQMKVSQILPSIETQPQAWVQVEDNEFIFSFEYQGFTFLKLSNNLGGAIKLINKSQDIHMVWDGDDAVGSQLWSSVIVHYVNTYIIAK